VGLEARLFPAVEVTTESGREMSLAARLSRAGRRSIRMNPSSSSPEAACFFN
jgi:hypothetical protein